MAYRAIIGTVLALSLFLSANLTQAFTLEGSYNSRDAIMASGHKSIYLNNEAAERFLGDTRISEFLLLMKAKAQQGGSFCRETSILITTSVSPHLRAFLQGANFPLLTEWPHTRDASSNPARAVLTKAYAFLNTPYRRGSSLRTSNATDCSGFVQYIYKRINIDLPRSSSEQARVGKVAAHTLDFCKLLAGDLLFFNKWGTAYWTCRHLFG